MLRPLTEPLGADGADGRFSSVIFGVRFRFEGEAVDFRARIVGAASEREGNCWVYISGGGVLLSYQIESKNEQRKKRTPKKKGCLDWLFLFVDVALKV